MLALQGAFEKHREICPVPTRLVRYPHELDSCDGLIIPGGESTTIWKQMEEMDFIPALKNYTGALFGTCAGLIILAKLGLLAIEVERNGYGRQIDSFLTSLEFDGQDIAALFIRAPRILSVGKEVEVLARHKDEPVIVQQGRVLASTFHPELTGELALHHHFLRLCEG
ncbi:MAG: Pyridoxal 5'-phosphate synthase subunit PdxT [Chlamydiales bacterium]|nr:Pyridoxal 5'-phosphate synthase subunit PdxT [Chlamydiales bacterium]MCH9636168.1 Pyridoxal 5'-phosphate synthase subunit PdxT [Chlamydiales bacterium]